MDILLTIVIVLPGAYLIGSVSSAYLMTRARLGIDIRSVGSGNAGAVNVFQKVGPASGVAVLLLDALKGAAVILAVDGIGLPDYALFTGAMAVVLGHNWPVFLRFRGGKGVAAVFGICLALLPAWTAVALGATLLAGLATRNLVFGVAAGILTLNALTVATGQESLQIGLCLTLSALVITTHYALSYREVRQAVRERGVWGLFSGE